MVEGMGLKMPFGDVTESCRGMGLKMPSGNGLKDAIWKCLEEDGLKDAIWKWA